MLALSFRKTELDPVNILCIGAHCDDIEIGCGGTILLLKSKYPKARFHWVVLSAPGRRGKEAEIAAQLFADGCEQAITLKQYRDGFMPYDGGAVKEFFETLKSSVRPDLIFTHWLQDAHQDHRLASELTFNTFRDHMILEYEIPKYDGDIGRPNFFVPLEKSLCERKVDLLFQAFQSQAAKHWFDRQTFLGLMRIRGMEANSQSGFAEAFHARKVVFSSCP